MNDHTTEQSSQEIPYGFCHCGCGQKTTIVKKSNSSRGWVKGQPLRYISGHNSRQHGPPPPEYCECGCGQRLKQPSKPSDYRRFISGHSRRRPIENRLWEKIDKRGPDDCWNWIAPAANHGYGMISVGNKNQLAHRVAWELAYGPIPNDLFVLHKCDNPLCCNVAHLFLGTNQDNMDDMVRKGRHRPTQDQIGEANPTALLTEKEVIEIRHCAANGELQTVLARRFGVSQSNISSIVQRVTWKHI